MPTTGNGTISGAARWFLSVASTVASAGLVAIVTLLWQISGDLREMKVVLTANMKQVEELKRIAETNKDQIGVLTNTVSEILAKDHLIDERSGYKKPPPAP